MVACTPAPDELIASARASIDVPDGVIVVAVPFTVRVKLVAELIFPVVGSVTVVSPAGTQGGGRGADIVNLNGVGSVQCARGRGRTDSGGIGGLRRGTSRDGRINVLYVRLKGSEGCAQAS